MIQSNAQTLLTGVIVLLVSSGALGLDQPGQKGSDIELGIAKPGDPEKAGGLAKREGRDAGTSKTGDAILASEAKPIITAGARPGLKNEASGSVKTSTSENAAGLYKYATEEAIAKIGDPKQAGGVSKSVRPNGTEGIVKVGDPKSAGGEYKP